MDVKNKYYKGQGIHVITALFTVEQGVTKVLLIKRKNEPFLGDWVLTGGALYNNEDLESGAFRELKEKTGIENPKVFAAGPEDTVFTYFIDHGDEGFISVGTNYV